MNSLLAVRTGLLLMILAAAVISTASAEAPVDRYGRPTVVSPKIQSNAQAKLYFNKNGYFQSGSGSSGGSSGNSSGNGNSSPTPPPQPEYLPFDHFDADDNGDSIANSYLLSYLSMAVYSGATNEFDFELELAAELAPQGINTVEGFYDSSTGTEGAFVWTSDVVAMT